MGGDNSSVSFAQLYGTRDFISYTLGEEEEEEEDDGGEEEEEDDGGEEEEEDDCDIEE